MSKSFRKLSHGISVGLLCKPNAYVVLMPSLCGILVYRLLTSNVHRTAWEADQ